MAVHVETKRKMSAGKFRAERYFQSFSQIVCTYHKSPRLNGHHKCVTVTHSSFNYAKQVYFGHDEILSCPEVLSYQG